MISLPMGVVAICAVLFFALGDMKLSTLMNEHSLVLVVGGTLAVLALSTPWKDIRSAFAALMGLWRADRTSKDTHKQLIELVKKRDAKLASSHPMVIYAQELWEQGLEADMFSFLLNQRREELNQASERIVAVLRNLAKYPPAMGMTGTVMGMVGIFSNLSAENRGKLGPALALAMTATFFGLILANMILLPLSDRLMVLHLQKKKSNEYIFRALLLIQRGEPESVIGEEVNAIAA